jgi:hypothetical protein
MARRCHCACRGCLTRSVFAAWRRIDHGEGELARAILELLARDVAAAAADEARAP